MGGIITLKSILESAGYEVDTAQSGFNAVMKAMYAGPDLILMDISMMS